MKITIENNNKTTTVDLYSPEGLELISGLWLKLCAQYKLMYETTWLGVPIIQLPEDIVIMQEMIGRYVPMLSSSAVWRTAVRHCFMLLC